VGQRDARASSLALVTLAALTALARLPARTAWTALAVGRRATLVGRRGPACPGPSSIAAGHRGAGWRAAGAGCWAPVLANASRTPDGTGTPGAAFGRPISHLGGAAGTLARAIRPRTGPRARSADAVSTRASSPPVVPAAGPRTGAAARRVPSAVRARAGSSPRSRGPRRSSGRAGASVRGWRARPSVGAAAARAGPRRTRPRWARPGRARPGRARTRRTRPRCTRTRRTRTRRTRLRCT
jgi:hypothetical protein